MKCFWAGADAVVHCSFARLMSTSHFRLPYGYKEAPSWPSLYWPFGPDFNPLSLIADIPHSLYYMKGKQIRSKCQLGIPAI